MTRRLYTSSCPWSTVCDPHFAIHLGIQRLGHAPEICVSSLHAEHFAVSDEVMYDCSGHKIDAPRIWYVLAQ